MKYLFLKRKDEGTNIDLYIVKIYVCVSIYIFSSLIRFGHHIKCIFVHNIYWLENVDCLFNEFYLCDRLYLS